MAQYCHPEVSKVAETLAEFRGRYKYNLLDDEHVRRFNAEVPQIWQWDDHEVVNNWSDSKDLSGDPRYTEKNVPLLIARGTRAFLEYAPMRYTGRRKWSIVIYLMATSWTCLSLTCAATGLAIAITDKRRQGRTPYSWVKHKSPG